MLLSPYRHYANCGVTPAGKLARASRVGGILLLTRATHHPIAGLNRSSVCVPYFNHSAYCPTKLHYKRFIYARTFDNSVEFIKCLQLLYSD